MHFLRALLGCLLPAILLGAVDRPNFTDHVRPILQAKCATCHAGEKAQGKLDLGSVRAILRGGTSGPAITAGAAARSLLIEKITTGQMPPGKDKLAPADAELLRRWIEAGAPENAAAAHTGQAHDFAVTEDDVLPIFQVRCVNCHGKRQQLGGLDLRTRDSRLKGGKSGPGLIPGNPGDSLILRKMESGEMPPMKMLREYAVRSPTAAEVDKVRRWIAAGAPGPNPDKTPVADAPIREQDRKFWAFEPPAKPPVPKVNDRARVRNPIDAFLLAKLESKGMTYSPEADRLKLMRRAYLDLTGMPPSPAEVDAYLKDSRPEAYEQLVNHLLESPHYGERWGRYWLDLAGYSDSEGFGQDDGVRPYAWRYRDYVIRAFNSDRPYNVFLTEQIAGDEMADYRAAFRPASRLEVPTRREERYGPPKLDFKPSVADGDTIDRLAATGFLRTAPDPTNATERAFIAERFNIIADEVEVFTSSVMGLTIGCARCHNHKYDPISQREYYKLSAIFQTSFDPFDWRPPKEREYPVALEPEWNEINKHNRPILDEYARLQARLDELAKPYREQAADDPDATIERLMRRFPEFKTKAEPLDKELNTIRGKLKQPPHVRVLIDNGGAPSPSYLLRRGDPTSLTEAVEPGVPAIFDGIDPYRVAPPYPGADSSGRRLALARWLTQPRHPLTARVFVNQMWLRHFGRGIVASPSNFGKSGTPPTHPELLDWLATEFVARGWSVKEMHRLMMTSAAYRQSSAVTADLIEKDPENALVSRMPLRRLDAESLYDSVLRATGRLNPEQFGPPEPVEIRPDKEVVPKGGTNGYRRGVYVLHRRQTPVTMFDVFDQPAMTPNCVERRLSTVATQALQMMNGTVVWEHSKYMAGRIIDEAGDDRERQVEHVFRRALARPPAPEEKSAALESLREMERLWPARLTKDRPEAPLSYTSKWMSLATLCHTMLNSAEFAYAD